MVPVQGGELAVFQYGDGDGTPVLLIHGVTSSNRAFQLFADALIARGKTPFAVDLRGRGDSNSLQGPFGMRQHAADMSAVINHFGWDTVDVIGHSMGGFVAAALVANKDLKGIFGTNEGVAIGAGQAFKAAGIANGSVKLIGYDSGKAQIDNIKSGLQQGAITQSPLGIGAKTVEALVNFVRNKKTPKPLIDTGFYYYDATNITKPEIAGNLYQ